MNSFKKEIKASSDHRKLWRILAGQATAFVAALFFITLPAHSTDSQWQGSSSRYEIRFMRDMVDHHHMAVMMTEICQMKATHHELMTMCATMHDSQAVEIVTMQTWLKSWYGIDYEPMMSPKDAMDMEKMEALSQQEFEVEFMNEMIPHHLKAIFSSTPCLVRATHGELINMCAGIISTQAEEVKMLREWLCAWYDECEFKKSYRRERDN
jgi:uncharacterized protein (DUF305 family)